MSLLDLAHAFSVFPRGGTIAPLSVTGARGIGRPGLRSLLGMDRGEHPLGPLRARHRVRHAHVLPHALPAMFKPAPPASSRTSGVSGRPRASPSASGRATSTAARSSTTGSIVPTHILTDVLTTVTSLFPRAGRAISRARRVSSQSISTATGALATAEGADQPGDAAGVLPQHQGEPLPAARGARRPPATSSCSNGSSMP